MGNIIDNLILDDDIRETIQGWKIHITNGYARISLKGKKIYLHHYICPPMPGMVTDHINRNRLDNRRDNLRVVTVSENLRNSAPRRGKLYKYVYKCGGGWEVRTPEVYKFFRTEEDAIHFLIKILSHELQ